MAVVSEIDTIEGTVAGALWFHFDIVSDVLYLRISSMRSEPVCGEETPEGFTLLRTEDGRIAGMTIVNYWQRFGVGQVRNVTLSALQERVESWAHEQLLAA